MRYICDLRLPWCRWMNLGEFIMETLNPIAEMYAGSHPLIRGRDATLVPVADGFTPPAFYDWLLWPFSAHKVRIW